jgi:peptidyl-prolyl cis-trans isomerase D
MIKKMRDAAPIIMWVVIVAFVGTIFFSWGMSADSRQAEPYVGKIGREKILLRTFDRQVAIERENQRQRMGGELPPQQSRMIPRQIFETHVSRALHDEVFDQLKLGATAEEVFEYLKNNPPPEAVAAPAFQTDSVFDTAKFVQFLNTPETYDNEGMRMLEAHTREMLIPMAKLKTLIESGIAPTRSEIAREYRARNEKIIFEYAKASSNSFSADSSEITDAMIQNYYTTHQDSFFEESQAELYYVRIPKKPTMSDEKIYYNELIDVKKAIESGDVTFEEEAKSLSDDEGSAQKGGDVGWFGKGAMVPAFEEKAFSMEPGEISDPVKSRFGYHLIELEDKKVEGDSVVQVKARHILRKIMPTVETLDSLENLANNLRKEMESKGFKQALAGNDSLTVDSTGLFKKGEPIRGIGFMPGLARFAFTQELDSIGERFEDERALYLVKVKRRTREGVLPLEEAKTKIVRTLVDSLQKQKARDYLEKAISALGEDAPLMQLSDADSLLKVGVTDTITRNQYAPGVGFNNEAFAAAFAVAVNKRSPIVQADGDLFVVRPLWRNEIADIPWDSPAVSGIRGTMMATAAQKVYYDWYYRYKERAKVVDNLDDFYMD